MADQSRKIDASITVTTSAQSLLSIVTALDANAAPVVAKIEITADDAATQPVFIGGSDLSDTNYSFKLSPGGVWEDDTPNVNNLSVGDVYLKAPTATSSQIVHVRIRKF